MLCKASLKPGDHDMRLFEIRSVDPQDGGPAQTMAFTYGMGSSNRLELLREPKQLLNRDAIAWLINGMPATTGLQIDPFDLPTAMHMLQTQNAPLPKAGSSFSNQRIPENSLMLEQHIWPCGKTNSRIHYRQQGVTYTSHDMATVPSPAQTTHIIAALVEQANQRLHCADETQNTDTAYLHDEVASTEQTQARVMRMR